MTSNENVFVIASHVPEFDDPLLHNVNNLCHRLRIQQDNIDKTEREIKDLLENILVKRGVEPVFIEKIMGLLSWSVSDYQCRKDEIYREVCLYLANATDEELNARTVATDIRKVLR